MERRREEIEKIDRAIKEKNFILCSELCFKVLYGLPADLQIELCCFMMTRYLPIFESKYSKESWPRKILNDVWGWAEKKGGYIPEMKHDLNSADSSFVYSFDALLLACSFREKKGLLTSSSVCAISSAIDARSDNVWIADDPEAAILWESGYIEPKRTVLENLPAISVEVREWDIVLNWLKEKEVCTYKDEVDIYKMNQVLEYWKEGEMTLIVPETRVLIEKVQKKDGLTIHDII